MKKTTPLERAAALGKRIADTTTQIATRAEQRHACKEVVTAAEIAREPVRAAREALDAARADAHLGRVSQTAVDAASKGLREAEQDAATLIAAGEAAALAAARLDGEIGEFQARRTELEAERHRSVGEYLRDEHDRTRDERTAVADADRVAIRRWFVIARLLDQHAGGDYYTATVRNLMPAAPFDLAKELEPAQPFAEEIAAALRGADVDIRSGGTRNRDEPIVERFVLRGSVDHVDPEGVHTLARRGESLRMFASDAVELEQRGIVGTEPPPPLPQADPHSSPANVFQPGRVDVPAVGMVA